ncbi:uncharacterized protein LOC124437560 [Xenia sp. Carnegie-2017]|uniref:uncharacterized protein LOC124437560 n=1 Tax=Xenia sp. Carnegie-2017 TaxID=2897299 RepID=UPI001F034CBC|nr:uncharacterized protein LOC124437560 [Xenia sp. Carnegie-2017]XP_046843485.1 uncharacterized protein LOC124437560 [Xenia sp. Carnegie-2017]XP_046843486.1 uncharacterized protein LOC124437560 [Xenia sp. Carnegie-2017]
MATAQDKEEQKELEHFYEDFPDHLKNILKVENFADCLHSFNYKELASSATDKYPNDFKKILEQATKDAFLFLKVLLPLTEEMLTFIQNFFEEYDDSYEEWEKEIKGIIKDVKENAKKVEVVGWLSEMLASVAKVNKMQTETFLKKLELEDNYKKNTDKCRKEEKSFKDHANVIINSIVKLYNGERNSNKGASSKDQSEEGLQKHFSDEIKDMLNALSKLIDSANGIAAFFFLIHKDIENCIKVIDSDRQKRNKSHFEATKKKSKDIKYQIQVCLTIIPNIRSSLDAIPKTGIDQSCVQEWLKNNWEVANRYEINSLPNCYLTDK